MANTPGTRGMAPDACTNTRVPGVCVSGGIMNAIEKLLEIIDWRIANPYDWYDAEDVAQLHELRTILLGTLADAGGTDAA